MALLKNRDYMPQADVNSGIEFITQIQLDTRTSAPSDSDLANGRLYYNSTTQALMARVNDAWLSLGATVSNFTSGGAVTFSGAYAFTGTLTGITGVTFPTTGTLATLAGTETLSGKTLTNPLFNGVRMAVVAKSAAYTLTTSDEFCGVTTGSSADVVITLPAATGSGRIYAIKKVDSGTTHVVVTPAGSDKIDGASTVTLSSQYSATRIIDGASGAWYVLGTI